MFVDNKFSKHFKSYLGKDAPYKFISSTIEESKYCSYVMNKHFNRELVMTKKIMKILLALLNVGCVIMFILIVMLKQETIVISLEDIEVLHIEIVKLNHKIWRH